MKLIKAILIIVGLFFYVLISAGILHGIERSNEEVSAKESIKKFDEFKAAKNCLMPDTINSMLGDLRAIQTSGLRLSPNGITGSSWDFPSSIFMCFQVMSAVGFGSSSPKTIGGKVFLLFYTFFGLALFVATALSIGEKLLQFVDWVRLKFGIRGRMRTALFIHTFRLTLLIIIGVVIFGAIPATIFYFLDPKFGFSEAFAVVSVGVVGYSDIINEYETLSPWYRLGIGIWAVLSLLWFSATFSTLRSILGAYNSDAIEIPSCCMRKKKKVPTATLR